ncbi:MAG: hypothetical protein JO244_13910 [Solirubrobacterales bacterium]|nr:hypothetical protein [Solirubrobacterales bacterium]
MSAAMMISDQNRVAWEEEHLVDGVQHEHCHAEPVGHLVAGKDPDRSQHLHDADDQSDPAPGPQAAEHVVRAAREHVRIGDRGDAVDQVEEADQAQQDSGEDD